jgi:uncharacterized protein YcaQ
MPRIPSGIQSTFSLSPREIARFRLLRHHLLDARSSNPITISRDVCGIQAQVMSAAHVALWARNHNITRNAIGAALWRDRSLVKTSLMRQTLHLIPTDEFALYISAIKKSRVAAVLNTMSRFGITTKEVDAFTAAIMDALASGPITRMALTEVVKPKASRGLRAWMEKVSSVVRIPVAEGLICYAPGEDNQATFVRIDQWLPAQRSITEKEAQCTLFRKYLRAYGPATVRDFAHWSGISMKDAKLVREYLKDELVEVDVDGAKNLLHRQDRNALKNLSSAQGTVKLLPAFDPYLLAHAEKDHLVEARHYKRVYGNQWWISPVVLLDGKVAGTWSYSVRGSKMEIEMQAFKGFSRTIRSRIEQEAASLAHFFGKELEVVAHV